MNRKQRRAQEKASSKPLPNLQPQNPKLESMFQQGRKLMEEGKIDKAAEIFRDIMRQKPDHIGAIENIGVCATRLKQYETALNFFKAGQQLNPSDLKWDTYIGCTYGEMDLYDKALPLLEKSYKNTGQEQIKGMLAIAYLQTGDFEKGQKYTKEILESDPYSIQNLYTYVTWFGSDEDEQDHIIERLLKIDKAADNLPNEDKAYLYYALYKGFNEKKEYEKAFSYAVKGAAAKRATLQYSLHTMDVFFASVQRYFSKDFFEKYKPEKQCLSEKPIFILAMPRSGTTLLEQILNAHPEIGGVGEDSTLDELIKNYSKLPDKQGIQYPFGWANNPERFMQPHEVGDKYVAYVTKKHPDAKYIANKAIMNYFHVGYINLALPNAKLIHIKRNPMDSCISMLTQFFISDAQKFTYNMEELGKRYQLYVRTIEHWKQIFPDKILEVEYEELVQDTESQAKRILEFIGAPWDPECLNFHKKKSIVKTASVSQVRKPIYTSSVDRWKRYGPQIIPLIEALGDCAPQEAQEYLKQNQGDEK